MHKTPIAARALSLALAATVTSSILAGIDTLAHQPVGGEALMAATPVVASAV
ncbi:MAG TPA: hypothetical protein VFQ20_13460 [Burkholderiaceae bacterium]|nr:hypothetical protein [Burkholderiaceae bacterium]